MTKTRRVHSTYLTGIWADRVAHNRETPMMTADWKIHMFCQLEFHKEIRHVRLGSDIAFF